jgi:hypothetical protein
MPAKCGMNCAILGGGVAAAAGTAQPCLLRGATGLLVVMFPAAAWVWHLRFLDTTAIDCA